MPLKKALGTTERAARAAEHVDERAEREGAGGGRRRSSWVVAPDGEGFGRHRGDAQHSGDRVGEAAARKDRQGGCDRCADLHDTPDQSVATRDGGGVVEDDEPQGGGEAGVVGLLRPGRARAVVQDAAEAHRAKEAPKGHRGRLAGLHTTHRHPAAARHVRQAGQCIHRLGDEPGADLLAVRLAETATASPGRGHPGARLVERSRGSHHPYVLPA